MIILKHLSSPEAAVTNKLHSKDATVCVTKCGAVKTGVLQA